MALMRIAVRPDSFVAMNIQAWYEMRGFVTVEFFWKVLVIVR